MISVNFDSVVDTEWNGIIYIECGPWNMEKISIAIDGNRNRIDCNSTNMIIIESFSN